MVKNCVKRALREQTEEGYQFYILAEGEPIDGGDGVTYHSKEDAEEGLKRYAQELFEDEELVLFDYIIENVNDEEDFTWYYFNDNGLELKLSPQY